MDVTMMEVDFLEYCPKCKHVDTVEVNDPCNDCLDQPWNEDSRKPIKFEPKDKKYPSQKMQGV